MRSPKPIDRVIPIAEEQWGLVTRRQAEAAGVPRATMERLTSSDSRLERVAHGVYRLAGAPIADHLDLRAAWLQLDPGVPGWARRLDQGVISHRSGASMYEIGHLPDDRFEFTLPGRKQTRRPDVKLHRAMVASRDCVHIGGMPVTRPARIAADLLSEREDPGAVAHVVADALRSSLEYPSVVASELDGYAQRFGLPRADGIALLRWLLDLVGDPGQDLWLQSARNRRAHGIDSVAPSPGLRSAAIGIVP